MEISLNKANKLYKKLQKYNYNPKSNFSMSLKLVTNLNECKDKIVSKVNEELDNWNTYKNIKKDLYNLKEKIFEANEKSNISKFMNDKELYKDYINTLENILDSNTELLSVNDITLDFISKIQNSNEPEPYRGFIFGIFDYKVFNGLLNDYKKQINSLDDKILELNAVTKIDVNFKDETKQFLGL